MALLLQSSVLTLMLLLVTSTSAVDMTSSSWRCVDQNKALNATSLDCTCSRSSAGSSFSWTNVDCTRRNFSNFAPNASLPLFIQRLDLSYNKITSLGESPFQHWNPLKELILSNNGMVSIIDNPFSGLELLTHLDLSYNKLTVLPSDLLINNTRIISVNFNFNNLHTLPPEIFSTANKLNSISLSHNIGIGKYISESPYALTEALKNGLKHLELNHVNLSRFPTNFFNDASVLSELYISDNLFTKVPDLFIGALQVLNLSGCDIERLTAGNFITLSSLKELYLDRLINLTVVQEGAFEGLRSLRTLSMENCVQLQSFHKLAFGPKEYEVKHLKQLSLIQSGLQVLSPDLRRVLKEVESVQLHGNPWHCDCNLAWLLDLNLTLHERKKLRCFSPPHLRAARIFSLTSDQLECVRPVPRVKSGLVVAMAVLLGVVCMVAAIGVLDFIRRHRWRSARRVGRYRPIEVQLEANRAEYECEDKELSPLGVTQTSASP
ncbi:tsukushi [Anabrus simplex]|uniref:tsukushi n=1 Tax=Anabrus simplex TaxID=316456 RepID=UPI0035A2C49C